MSEQQLLCISGKKVVLSRSSKKMIHPIFLLANVNSLALKIQKRAVCLRYLPYSKYICMYVMYCVFIPRLIHSGNADQCWTMCHIQWSTPVKCEKVVFTSRNFVLFVLTPLKRLDHIKTKSFAVY